MRLFPVSLLLLATPAAAQPEQPPAPDRWGLTFGLGAAVTPSYSGSDDYQLNPGGIIRGKAAGFNVTLQGLNLFVDAVRDGDDSVDIQAGPVVGLNLNRVNRIQDARVRALGELDAAVEVGGYAGVAKTGVITSAFDVLSLTVAYQRDVTGTHDSWRLTPQLGYGTPISQRTFVAAAVNATIVGDGFARTYFGVTPEGAAASGLRAYDPDGGLQDVGVNLLVIRSLSGDIRQGWSLFGLAGYSRLVGDSARSPIVADVGDADQFIGALGLAYTF